MTTAMARLQEKTNAQNKTAENLRQRFYEALEIAMNDGGFCYSEAEYFGGKELRKALKQIYKNLPEEES
ncbi:hypothetical protein LCGC14_1294400 [marine sediment metagenome]|uniref:Uncharacterized protein n=1 Tax=marine sediment metagenome TaxID=412755 RepID=A0A0F9NUF7_9ZZZZ